MVTFLLLASGGPLAKWGKKSLQSYGGLSGQLLLLLQAGKQPPGAPAEAPPFLLHRLHLKQRLLWWTENTRKCQETYKILKDFAY